MPKFSLTLPSIFLFNAVTLVMATCPSFELFAATWTLQSSDATQEEEASAKTDLQPIIDTLNNPRKRLAKAAAAVKLADHQDQYQEFAVPLAGLLLDGDRVLNDIAKRIFKDLGKKSVEALNPDFDGDIDDLRMVCSVINAVGDDGAEYTPQLLNILKTSDDPLRRTAATYALTGFSHGNAEAIDLIIPDLDSSDMNVTLFAMRLIIKTGPQAKQAAPKLIELYNDGLPSQRGYAAWSLAAISPVEGFDTAEAADKMLNRFTVSERERGLIAAGILGKAAESSLKKVEEMMANNRTNIEGQAAVTYWRITGDGDSAARRLIELTKHDMYYEINGLKLIAELGPAAEPALELLLEKLKSADSSTRVLALDAIQAIGPAASIHRSEIEKVAEEDGDPIVRLTARQLLKTLPAPATETKK